MRLNIRRRLVVLTCFFVLITGITTYFYSDYTVKKALSQQIETKLSTNACYFMHSLDAFMYERMLDIKGFTYESALHSENCDSSFLHNYLLHRLSENPTFENLLVFDQNKNLTVSSVNDDAEQIAEQFSSLWEQFQRNDLVVDYLFNNDGTIRKLNIAYQFRCNGLNKYLVGTIPIKQIYSLIESDYEYLNITDRLDIDLVDRSGVVVYTNRHSLKADTISSTKLNKITNLVYNPKNTFSREFFEDGDQVCFISTAKGYHDFKGNNWHLILSIPRKDAYLPLIHLNESVINIFSVILIFLGLFVFLISKYFTAPLTKLTLLAEAYAGGDFSYKIKIRQRDEFGQLGKQMMAMARELKEKMYQKSELNHLLQNKLDLVSLQKKKIEASQEQIEAGLRYAKKIQKALLPGSKRIGNLEYDVAVFYEAFHEVSGDYYFLHEFKVGDESYFAAAVVDCTGHGVPGAFMTFITHHLLVYLFSIKKLVDPALVLRELDLGLKRNLEGKESENLQDGMDVSVVVLKKSNSELRFAGARRPLYIVSEDRLTEVVGSKRSIGDDMLMYQDRNFENYISTFKEGDQLFMFTDGVTDQFGGGNNKKIGRKRLKEWIVNSKDLDRHEYVISQIKSWKGLNNQVDDMTFMTITI